MVRQAFDREYAAVGVLDTLDHICLHSEASEQPIEVRRSDHVRLAVLHCPYRRPEAWTLVQRLAAAHVQLVEDVDEQQPVRVTGRPDAVALVLRRDERLALAALLLRDAHDPIARLVGVVVAILGSYGD